MVESGLAGAVTQCHPELDFLMLQHEALTNMSGLTWTVEIVSPHKTELQN